MPKPKEPWSKRGPTPISWQDEKDAEKVEVVRRQAEYRKQRDLELQEAERCRELQTKAQLLITGVQGPGYPEKHLARDRGRRGGAKSPPF